MPISVTCTCGRGLRARDEFAGTRAECPTCGRLLTIPLPGETWEGTAGPPPLPDQAVPPPLSAGAPPPPLPDVATNAASAAPRGSDLLEESRAKAHSFAGSPADIDIEEFLDPPHNRPPAPETPAKAPVFQRMFEALLDPRAIHWMLTIGGGLTVLGLVIWLVSLRVFDDPRIVAVALGVSSLGLLAAGWWTTLRTRFHVAGQALTFLACVVLPLNLWFYDAQNLVTVADHLWLGALVCVGLYAATVYVLRNPLFLYACEAGVTLTALLLLADVGMLQDVGNIALTLVALAAASIHLERAFAPEGEFSRRRYGLPLFWSGHGQLAAGLIVTFVAQSLGWMSDLLELDWPTNRLTAGPLLAGGLWIAAAWLYLYSDLVVRRLGVYMYLAGVSLVLAEVTLLFPHLNAEGLIVILALTGLGLQLLRTRLADSDGLAGHCATIGFLLTGLPVLLGTVLHWRATSETAAAIELGRATGWEFVGAMLLVAATARVSAHLCRIDWPQFAQGHFFLSAAALLIAAAGLLRQLGWVEWYYQAPLLMLVPIGYITAARLWRGHTPETPLARVAHVSTVVILIGTFFGALEQRSGAFFQAVTGSIENLYLGITFLEATLFYILAGMFRRRSWNAYFATLAGAGALWQFLGYFGVEAAYYPLLYAVLGIVGLMTARGLGLQLETRYDRAGTPREAVRGPGRTALRCGNAVLSLALLVAFLQGLLRLSETRAWLDLAILLGTLAAGAIAVPLSLTADWRRWYVTATVALAAVGFLQLNLLIDLNGWQKLEIFCVAVGVVALTASHIGRFREEERADDSVSLGLWLGSLFTVVPLFIAMLHYRFFTDAPSLWDELGLLTATILLVVSGCSWQIRATTLLGGSGLVLYLLILVGSLAYRPEVAIGVYLLVGGGVIFLSGVLLSIYRDRLMALPEMIARREGIFRIIGWR